MRKLLIPALLIASLGVTSLAMAATTEGVIKTIDAKALTVTLNDGSIYSLPKTYKVADLKAGAKVKVLWDAMGAKKQATRVDIEK